MDIFFPAQTLSLLQGVAPWFTPPSFAYFQSSVGALLVVEGRQCLTRLARWAFCHPRDRSRWERCRAVSRWSLTAITERLVPLVGEKRGAPLQGHGASLVGTAPPWSPRRPRSCRGSRRGKPTVTTPTADRRCAASTGIWWGGAARGGRGGGVGPWGGGWSQGSRGPGKGSWAPLPR